jgi:hypothetical protein
LVDAREFWVKMRKSLGDKRKEISAEQIAEITRLYGDFIEDERVKIFPNEAFGYLRITVERFDLENNLIHVENGWDREEGLIQPKSAAGVRDVPIIPTLRDLLVKWKLGCPWSEGLVFGRTTTNPFDPSTIHARARKVWSEAGLPSLSLHEARHSYASMLIAAGDAPRSIMELMGHSSITVTYDTYGKLFLGTHASSGDRLQTYIDAASNPSKKWQFRAMRSNANPPLCPSDVAAGTSDMNR